MMAHNTWVDSSALVLIFYVILNVSCVFAAPKNPTKVRLVGGSGPHEGHIQVLMEYKDDWRYICPNHWDMRDAKVICRQLHYTKALNATTKSFVALNSTDYVDQRRSYWLDSVQCWGSETDINYCWHRPAGKHNCIDPTDRAGVICSNVTETEVKLPVPSLASGIDGSNMKVRLRGAEEHGFVSKGYLEVYYQGLWRYVCADGWTSQDSYVACGHLGYPDVEDETNKVDLTPGKPDEHIDYWMNEVQCNGTESALYECDHAGWKRHTCKKNRAVHLKCKRSPLLVGNRFDKVLLTEHTARLRAGSRHSEGRVEIHHKGRWGTICDDKWDIKAANVFCRSVGFGTALEAVHYASFGQGVGKVWLDEVRCNGLERNITECEHMGWGEGDCGHPEDAGVKCHFPYSEPKVRVVDDAKVEVLSHGTWKSVCGIGFGLNEAQVVCREAGLGFPKRGYSSKLFGKNNKVGIYRTRCSGDELSLHYCFHTTKSTPQKRKWCSKWVAAVECTTSAPDLVTDYKEVKKTMKLETIASNELSCAQEEGCLGSDFEFFYGNLNYYRSLLRFTSLMHNRGTADFRPFQQRSKWFWHRCHGHYHSMARFSDYDLTDAVGKKMGEGLKASFCLEDTQCDGGVEQKFHCVRQGVWGDQGISPNCADNYKWNIDCQWIDISRAHHGNYTMRIILNPIRKVFESDYTNNIVHCDMTYITWPRAAIEVRSCDIATCEQPSHGGTGGGACCKFPFMYKGKEYRHCTTAGFKNHAVLWCATTTDYDNDKLWGHCRP